jgi:hypothetical protein
MTDTSLVKCGCSEAGEHRTILQVQFLLLTVLSIQPVMVYAPLKYRYREPNVFTYCVTFRNPYLVHFILEQSPDFAGHRNTSRYSHSCTVNISSEDSESVHWSTAGSTHCDISSVRQERVFGSCWVTDGDLLRDVSSMSREHFLASTHRHTVCTCRHVSVRNNRAPSTLSEREW